MIFTVFGLAILAFSVIAHNASAATYVFTGTTSADGNTASNWNQVGSWTTHNVPTTGDNVIFNSTSGSKACTWDVPAVSLGFFQMNTGYSGTITQSTVSLVVSSFNQIAGTFSAQTATYHIVCSGNFIISSSFQALKGLIYLPGTGYISTINALMFLWINGTYTDNSSIQVNTASNSAFVLAGSLSFAGLNPQLILSPGISTISITGTLNCPGGYYYYGVEFYESTTSGLTNSLTLTGNINANVAMCAGNTKSSTIKLLGNAKFNSLLISSYSGASYVMTLDLNGYNLITGSLTLNNYAVLKNSASTNSWIHTNAFINMTGSDFYTTKIYYSLINWSPHLINAPTTSCLNNSQYYYKPSYNETVTSISLLNSPAWASITNNIITGTPTRAGTYFFNETAISQNGTIKDTYQWAVVVSSTGGSGTSSPITLDSSVFILIIELALISLLTYAGIKDHRFMALSGIAWIAISITLFQPYNNSLGLLGAFTGIILGFWGLYWIVIP